MRAERWRQIEELYQAALAQPAEKRAAFRRKRARMIGNCPWRCIRCWISRPIRFWKARRY
jgi:hypothetical protein